MNSLPFFAGAGPFSGRSYEKVSDSHWLGPRAEQSRVQNCLDLKHRHHRQTLPVPFQNRCSIICRPWHVRAGRKPQPPTHFKGRPREAAISQRHMGGKGFTAELTLHPAFQTLGPSHFWGLQSSRKHVRRTQAKAFQFTTAFRGSIANVPHHFPSKFLSYSLHSSIPLFL